jgi:hypothetical protein
MTDIQSYFGTWYYLSSVFDRIEGEVFILGSVTEPQLNGSENSEDVPTLHEVEVIPSVYSVAELDEIILRLQTVRANMADQSRVRIVGISKGVAV